MRGPGDIPQRCGTLSLGGAVIEPLPHTLGPYTILHPLHQGNSTLLLASAPHHAPPVAIKLNPADPERLWQEFQTLHQLAGSGGCPRPLAWGETRKTPWFAMEYIPAPPVLQQVRAWGRAGSPARVSQVQQVAQEMFAALGEIHQRGVLHCDLKGSNVLRDPDGRVRLIDFGSARQLCPAEGTCSGARFAGTFGCAPPEQLVGAFLDARTDLFAAGVLLYRLLTDRLPFWGRSLPECLRELHTATPRPPSGPPGLVALIMESLSPRPERRPLSAAEALRRIPPPLHDA